MKQIKSLSLHERPRERIAQTGAKSLSDQELLQAILGSGSRKMSVVGLADEVLKVINEKNDSLTLKCLTNISGVGSAKASLMCAALEFARRRIRPEGNKVSCAHDVFLLVQHLARERQEHFICISLNGAHEVIATRVVTVGLVNATQIHAREVFADPITDRATAVVIAHNHPSGQLEPSSEDLKATKFLVEAGKILGIKVLDHVIFGKNGFFSLQEKGIM